MIMSDKVEDPSPVEMVEQPSDYKLHTTETNTTSIIGFEETEEENFRYGFTRSVAFVVRISLAWRNTRRVKHSG
jgi:hypothetical protein